MQKKPNAEKNELKELRAEVKNTLEIRIMNFQMLPDNPRSRIGEMLKEYGLTEPFLECIAKEYGVVLSDNEKDLAKRITQMHNVLAPSTRSAYVIVKSGTYHVLSNNKYRIYDTNTLPRWMAKSIGFLKLNNVGETVSGAGHRAAENRFYIVENEYEGED